jgi:chromosome segregation ATPase
MARSAKAPEAALAASPTNGELAEARLLVLRQLQSEAAAALASWSELESAFEERLRRAAGDVMVEASRLRDELERSQDLARSLEAQRDEAVTVLAESTRHVAEKEWVIAHQQERMERLQRQALVLEGQLAGHQARVAALDADQERNELTVAALERAQAQIESLESRLATGPIQPNALQLEALESEIARYQRAFEAQRQRYAEAQAALVERELLTRRLEARLAEEQRRLERLRGAAATKIQTLQRALARAGRLTEPGDGGNDAINKEREYG